MLCIGFPRLYAAASLKRRGAGPRRDEVGGFPRLYAAASLKPAIHQRRVTVLRKFSAALCRGLIEAGGR